MHTCPQRQREREGEREIIARVLLWFQTWSNLLATVNKICRTRKIPQAGKKKTSSAYFMNESKNNRVLFLENSGHKRRWGLTYKGYKSVTTGLPDTQLHPKTPTTLPSAASSVRRKPFSEEKKAEYLIFLLHTNLPFSNHHHHHQGSAFLLAIVFLSFQTLSSSYSSYYCLSLDDHIPCQSVSSK